MANKALVYDNGKNVAINGTSSGQAIVFDGTDWAAGSTPYDLSGEYPGNPPVGASQELFHFRAVRNFRIIASGTSASTAYAETAPSGGTVTFTITKKPQTGSNSTVGTIEFTTGSNSGTVTIGSTVSFVPGDRIIITSQDTSIYSIANVYWTFFAVTP